MSDEELAAIRARCEAATVGPWETERSVSMHWDHDVHWVVRTRDKLPEHPWSPRYLLWMCGLLWEASSNHQPKLHWCENCQHMYYRNREVPVDLRHDLEIEADAQFIAHAREDIPRLIAEVERLRSLAGGRAI